MFELTNTNAEKFNKVCKILEENQYDPHRLIPILQAVQNEYRYLPEEILRFIASSLGISPAKVYGVTTFYSHFTLEPKGKYVIKVCDGTACHVKKSESIIQTIEKKLGLTQSQKTTEDMLFTLETVSCLGACGLAPVVVVNEEVHSLMTPEKTERLIENIKKEETYAETVC
ncbi:Fe-only hydrogenase, subunit gamma [Melioribacter roseus P3M-2]|uniref:Fe-only hydrogenase, subunit gamma n=1 Tax=Melioribacter roseus (strain DSM 23840 / JCM 17771 / VKM B-2668 / P3M-2) TaxID=1191523 RepID=I6ZPA4_MELRP|nr:NADH-quinone oxidoreductase subunit NuoE [Melioribacter roseus]AFN73879.1 Fe-only hydrogenase, subunit gamma [Melioribacter roseus P3M-2]